MGIPLIDGGMKTTKMPVYVSVWVLWTDWKGYPGVTDSQLEENLIL